MIQITKKLFDIIFISARFQTNGKKLWEYQPRIIKVMFLLHKGNFRKYYHCVDGVSLPSRMYVEGVTLVLPSRLLMLNKYWRILALS